MSGLTSRERLRQVLGDREEALATLLERAGNLTALRHLRDGAPQWITAPGSTRRPVVQIRLRAGAPGEVLDIKLRDGRSRVVERVLYRCLAISAGESIESTPRDFPATWHAAQIFAADTKVSKRPRSGRTAVRVVSAPTRKKGTHCRACGRRKLSRQEYNWRRRNGYAVWRCQHRRPSPSRSRGLVEAGGVVAALVVYALVVAM